MFKKKYIRFFLKLIITILAFICIFFQIKNRGISLNIIDSVNTKYLYLLIIVVLLMYINWLVESIKWQILINNLERVSLVKSIQSVLTGLVFALITPNRTGEIAGRVIYINKRHQISAMVSTTAGSLSQMLTTFIFGFSGMCLASNVFINHFPVNLKILLILFSIFSFFIFYLFFNIKTISHKIFKIKVFKNIAPYFTILQKYNYIELSKVFGLSIFRYIIFLSQFVILFKFFNVDMTLVQGIIVICLTYFTMSFIPHFAIAEIGVRGTIILFFAAFYCTNLSGVLFSAFMIWFINLVLPAIFGSLIFCFRTK